jgi:phosphoribosylamine--glycine ligase
VNVLVIGGGGREHALIWKIAQSPQVDYLYCTPGNPGIARAAQCVDISVNDSAALLEFANQHAVDLTVVGPEAPLANGIVDLFVDQGLMAFGPSKAAAELEASKSFAKRLMAKYGIPTAEYAEFDDADEAIAYVTDRGAPIVVKADGLAAGKGVTVAHDVDAATVAIRAAMTEQVFGDAGSRVVIEECLVGEEASILAFSDGTRLLTMVPSQDHKPVDDGDKGPNTGGMGAYSPAPVVTPELAGIIERAIMRPCVEGMACEGTPYKGVLYAGLMINDNGPKVVEFNCRFGDPEAQVVLPRLKSDIVPAFLACCDGTLDTVSLEWDDQACVTVVMASGGYPGTYEKGKPITGIEAAEADPAVTVFHAGTKETDAGLVTNGGRVLNVTALGPNIPRAIDAAYAAAEKIHFERAHKRSDIGEKALARLDN